MWLWQQPTYPTLLKTCKKDDLLNYIVSTKKNGCKIIPIKIRSAFSEHIVYMPSEQDSNEYCVLLTDAQIKCIKHNISVVQDNEIYLKKIEISNKERIIWNKLN